MLEQYHISESFKVLREYNFLDSLDKSKASEFRAVCIKLILSTDMAYHDKDLKDLKMLLDLNKEDNGSVN